MSKEKKEWLVVFFVHEIWESDTTIGNMITSIEQTGCGSETAFYLLRDSIERKNERLNFTLTLHRLEDKKGYYEFAPVKDFIFDNEDRNCWADGLKHIFSKVEGRRNMIITLSHGAAFGINRNSEPVTRPPNPHYYFDRKEIEELQAWAHRNNLTDSTELKRGIVNKEYNNKRISCRSLEILWTAELAKVLERLPGKPQIDIMLMANCFMQSFESGYILRKSVKYLVAAQTGIPANGYNLINLMDYIEDSNITTEELLHRIKKDYESYYTAGDLFSDNVAFSANCLLPYKKALRLFEKLLKIIERNFSTIHKKLIDIRETQIEYVSFPVESAASNYLMMVDAYQWLKLILETFPHLFAGTNLADDFEKLLSEIIIVQHKGSYIIDYDQIPQLPKYGMYGISIFYPKKHDYLNLEDIPFCAYFDRKIPSPFRMHSRWDEFLKKFYTIPNRSEVKQSDKVD